MHRAWLCVLLVIAVSLNAQDAKPEEAKPTEAAPSGPQTVELRKECWSFLKATLAKAPIKGVAWKMGSASDKASITGIDEKLEALKADFQGMSIDLKWKTIDLKQLSSILRAASGSDDKPELEPAALAAAVMAADGAIDGANSYLGKVTMKEPKIQPRYEELVKKYNLAASAPKPKPVVATGSSSSSTGSQSSASAAQPPPSAWEPSGLSGGGSMYVPSISPVDPKLMMVSCDMSAQYISRDGGKSWRMIHYKDLFSNTRCRAAFHPGNVNVIYSSAGWAGMKVSQDCGIHWEPIGGITSNLRGEIAIDPGNPLLMLVGSTEGVLRSVDAGKSWKKVSGPTGEAHTFHFDQTSPIDKRVCFVGTSDGIFRSDDGGVTWAEKSAGLPGKKIVSFAGSSSAKDKVCMLYCTVPSKNDGGKFTGGVFCSTDRGEKWESCMGGGLNMDLKAADAWSMGDISQYTTVLSSNAKPATVYTLNTNTGIYPPHFATVYRSDDSGKTWRPTFYGDPRFGKEFNVAYDYCVAAVAQFYQPAVMGATISQTNAEILAYTDMGRVFITNNGGHDWFNGHSQPAAPAAKYDKTSMWLNTGLVVTSVWNYYIDPFEPNRHYTCYTDIGFALSMDAGKTWRWWDHMAPWANTCYELAFDPKIPGKIWGAFSDVHDIPNGNIINGGHSAKGGGGICVSTDFANTWKVSNSGLPVQPALGIVLDPRSPPGNRTLYAGVFGEGVFKSTDDGKTWVKKSNGLGSPKNMRVSRVVLHEDGTLFAVITAMKEGGKFLSEGVGIYRSKDGGEKWEHINASQPLLWPKDLTPDPKDSRILYVGAADAEKEDGGLWRTTDGGATWKKIARQGSQHFGAYFHPHRPGWIYMTLAEGAWSSGIWLSKDNGATFQPLSEVPFSVIQRVTVDPKNDNLIYLSTFGGSVWRGPAE